MIKRRHIMIMMAYWRVSRPQQLQIVKGGEKGEVYVLKFRAWVGQPDLCMVLGPCILCMRRKAMARPEMFRWGVNIFLCYTGTHSQGR